LPAIAMAAIDPLSPEIGDALLEPAICAKGGGGPFLPLFGDSEQEWPRGLRITLYLFGLLWCFMGVSIIADVFMSAIEKVTSKKVLRLNKATGRRYTYEVWNATVANLTLMALGSSAPEILLNVIDIFAKEFFSEGLGPGTIVGSAAYNLLMIIAVCIVAIPDGQVRKIKDLTVYTCTASWSVFAYLWLIVILVLITPNVVDLWEGVVTFLFFPLLTLMAWCCDKGYLGGSRTARSEEVVVHEDMTSQEVLQAYAAVRKKHGENLTDDQVARLMVAMNAKPPSRAVYRVNASRALFGGRRLKPVFPETVVSSSSIAKVSPVQDEVMEQRAVCTFYLPVVRYALLESAAEVCIPVRREGDLSLSGRVYFTTVPGTARPGSDYEHVEGWLLFAPREEEKQVAVTIVNDDAFEIDESFYFRLADARVEGSAVAEIRPGGEQATITIIDDDDPGVISFGTDVGEDAITITQHAEESTARVRVQRKNGSCGEVRLRYHTEGDTALPGRDFEACEGQLVFADKQTEAVIEVAIKSAPRYDARNRFRIILTGVEGGARFDPARDGGKERSILTVFVEADAEMKARVDRTHSILRKTWERSRLGHANWSAQFREAIMVHGGAGDDGDACPPTWLDYIAHAITLPWKLVFAIVPPTDFCGGWLCFGCSLLAIGVVTMIINDMAALLGCVMCLPDEITAITFVAMGTSLPDTFASISAAKAEPYADSSVGNVTGSNSVNVFLGLGLPWMIAAFAWSGGGSSNAKWQWKYQWMPELTDSLGAPGSREQAFVVLAGSLSFSVAVFSACAVICIALLAVRRRVIGGELGGSKASQWASSAVLCCLWLLYIGLSSWKALESGGGCAA